MKVFKHHWCIWLLKSQFQNTRERKTQKNVKCVHIINCAKVRALFAEYKVRFARADQLWQ